MSHLQIYMDVDNVLADYTRHFIEWFNLPIRSEDIKVYDMLYALYGDKMDQVADNEEFHLSIPKLPWADRLMKTVRDQGHDISLATACLSKHRLTWAQRHYPGIPVYQCKEKWTLSEGPHCVLIDDHWEQCSRFKKDGGGQAILFPAPWNQHPLPDNQDPVEYVDFMLHLAAGKVRSVRNED